MWRLTSPLSGARQKPQTMHRGRRTPTTPAARPLERPVRRHYSHGLKLFRRESGVLGDAREHSGADLFAVMEREDEIGPALPR